VTGSSIHGNTFGCPLLEDVIERLQFSIAAGRLTLTPTGGADLGLVVGDDLVVGVVHTLSSIWPLIDDLGGFGSHGGYDFNVKFNFDGPRASRTVGTVNQ